jgi:hypothetical protein
MGIEAMLPPVGINRSYAHGSNAASEKAWWNVQEKGGFPSASDPWPDPASVELACFSGFRPEKKGRVSRPARNHKEE